MTTPVHSTEILAENVKKKKCKFKTTQVQQQQHVITQQN